MSREARSILAFGHRPIRVLGLHGCGGEDGAESRGLGLGTHDARGASAEVGPTRRNGDSHGAGYRVLTFRTGVGLP